MPSFVGIQVNEPLPMSLAAIWRISNSHEFLVPVQQPKINSSPRLDFVCMLAWTYRLPWQLHGNSATESTV